MAQRWMAPGAEVGGAAEIQVVLLYGAIEPLKGQSVFWLMPDMRKELVKFFLERFRKEVEGKVALVWDQASGHRAMEGEILWGLIPSSCPHIVRS